MPAAMATSGSAPVEAAEPARFVAPGHPMLLTRELRREMPGGVTVRTLRTYEIRFTPVAGAFLIEGTLINVTIDVPERFSALGALEQQRSDDGLFPMRVDSRGRLLSIGTPDDEATIAAAIGTAKAQVEHGPLQGNDSAFADRFVGSFKQQRAITQWPLDLFMPATGTRTQASKVRLPGGAQGDVSVELEASACAVSGLLDRFRRTVTTSLGDSVRVVEEIWTLTEK